MSASSFRVVPGTRFALLTEAEHSDLIEGVRRVSIFDRVFSQARIESMSSNWSPGGNETSLKVVFPTQREAISACDVMKDARNVHGDRTVRPWDRDRVDISKAEHADLLASRDEAARLEGELDVALSRAEAAQRAAHDANEIIRSLRADEFSCETVVPIGDVKGSGNVWVRLRSTQDGVGMLVMQLCRLDQRAVLAEAALASANERCRHLEKRAERADWTASELRSAEFEWADSIPVDEPNGDQVLVRVRGTEGGIAKIKAFIENLVWHNGLLNRSLASASDRALEAEAKLAALEAEQAEALASVAGFEVMPVDATTYTVSCGDATMTVTGSPSGVANVVKLAYGGFEYGVSA